MEGMQRGREFATIDGIEGANIKPWVKQSDDSFTRNYNSMVPKTSGAQIVDGLDLFYKDFRNRSIQLPFAVFVVLKQIAGTPQADIQRRIYARQQQRALTQADFPFRGRAFHELGLAYFQLGQNKEALEAFDAALNEPRYYAKGRTLNSVGNVYFQLGQFAVASGKYREASDKGANPKFRLNLAESLRRDGKLASALRIVNNLLEKLPTSHPEYSRAEAVKKLANRRAAATAEENELVRPGNRLSWNSADPVTRIRAALLGQATKHHQYVEKYGDKQRQRRDDCLSVLRGWGSAAPFFDNGDGRGGGYFLRFADFGVVLDPGFDFVRNFHAAGFHALDINAIVVSHNHPDHNADLRTLESVLFEAKNASSTDDHRSKYTLATDGQTNTDTLDSRYRKSPIGIRFSTGPGRQGRIGGLSTSKIDIDYFEVAHGGSTSAVTDAADERFQIARRPES